MGMPERHPAVSADCAARRAGACRAPIPSAAPMAAAGIALLRARLLPVRRVVDRNVRRLSGAEGGVACRGRQQRMACRIAGAVRCCGMDLPAAAAVAVEFRSPALCDGALCGVG
ncbi:hypothetical protein DFQ30_002777 [Apophysomyces sp. BC1015]|nr:hypothetical protein DFQ30_002777 [Apophysomyces sp. BC1015]